MNWLISLLIALLPSLSLAQVVSVEFKDKGFLFSDAPTLTFLWQAKQPKATLIFIPGGEGKLGLTPERTNLGGFYGATLRQLSDDRLTNGFSMWWFLIHLFNYQAEPTILTLDKVANIYFVFKASSIITKTNLYCPFG